ncbi:type IV pilin protein [Inmirania thermothiophila]|uniref:Type IV pilus assembly protein PilE n=1 Tax=Inmirania thermothiophila TaxID=1750597 RepID=A0A3N1Y851_9GAMM|nr:type IV pilin protein [Inmirania thermothiophila]ROR34994.1 type IV pilus assembly protein PilE [Inmirania thermothiophila]
MARRARGFTLVELLIVVVIVAILATVAIPAYQSQATRSRRATAKAALMEFATVMERYYAKNGTYCGAGTSADADCGAGGTDIGAPTIFATEAPTDGTAYYDLTIADVSPTTYVLRATPKAGGPQAGDGYLELTNTGVRRWDRNGDGDTADADEDSWD